MLISSRNSFNFKFLVRQLVLGDYFAGSPLLGGTAKLLTPELLRRKIEATTGRPWNIHIGDNEWLDKYKGKYDGGYEVLRKKRLDNLKKLGFITYDENGRLVQGVPKLDGIHAMVVALVDQLGHRSDIVIVAVRTQAPGGLQASGRRFDRPATRRP